MDVISAENVVAISAGSFCRGGSEQPNILMDCGGGRNGSGATDADTIIL